MSKLQKFLPLLLAVVAIVGMIFGMRLQSSLESDGYLKKTNAESDLSINEALQHIKSKYYGDLDQDEFTDQVVSHMVDQLDGYSHYFEASDDTVYDRYIKGLYSGVGIEFAELDGSFYVSAVVPDSPADRAEVEPGDRILSVEDVSLQDTGIDRDSLMLLSGLTDGDTLDLILSTWPENLKREIMIPVSNVELSLVHDYIIEADEEISYVKIDRFYDGVFKEFMDALDHQAHDSSAVSNLIIDLRNNPGGVVEETVKLLNQLITEKEKELLKTIDRQGRTKSFQSNGRGFLDVDRIVVLINKKSASASEILAATLQDFDRALVLGVNSYGKGVIQQNYQLSNKGSMNLTVGAYVLPSGRKIDKAYSVDTTFYSVVHGREIVIDGPGVTPDVRDEKCDLNINRLKITSSMIEHQLWTIQGVNSLSDNERNLLIADVYGFVPSDSCYVDADQHLSWYLETEILEEGSRVSVDKADSQIQTAASLLLSDKFFEILEGRN